MRACLIVLLLWAACPARAQLSDKEAAERAVEVLKGYPSFRRTTRATKAQVALGKLLFFDKRLSRRGDLACATCHDPAKGYGDGLPRAVARGRQLPRKTVRLITTQFNRFLFWDGRTASVEEAALFPVQHPDEMDQDLPGLEAKLSAVPEYRRAFKAAYGKEKVASGDVGKALAAFVLSIPVAEDSAFDRFRARGDGLSPDAVKGLLLFMGRAGCARCHLRNKFYHNLGLAPADPPDLGRYLVAPSEDNWRAFRTPSLRNVARTGPYMHDGRFSTLREVIDYYDRGGDEDPHKDADIKPLNLSDAEKTQLEAFLASMTTSP